MPSELLSYDQIQALSFICMQISCSPVYNEDGDWQGCLLYSQTQNGFYFTWNILTENKLNADKETQVKLQIIKTVTGVQNKQSQDGNICISYCYDILINQMINWFSDKIIGRL